MQESWRSCQRESLGHLCLPAGTQPPRPTLQPPPGSLNGTLEDSFSEHSCIPAKHRILAISAREGCRRAFLGQRDCESTMLTQAVQDP